jgi:hypothetical protein
VVYKSEVGNRYQPSRLPTGSNVFRRFACAGDRSGEVAHLLGICRQRQRCPNAAFKVRSSAMSAAGPSATPSSMKGRTSAFDQPSGLRATHYERDWRSRYSPLLVVERVVVPVSGLVSVFVGFRAAQNALSIDVLLSDALPAFIHLFVGSSTHGDPRRGLEQLSSSLRSWCQGPGAGELQEPAERQA